MADGKIDAVSICTWNNTHAEISIAALEAGKHVLVEKSPAKSLEEALAMQHAVNHSGKILHVGVVRRYDSNAQMLCQFVENGEFGDNYFAKASAIRQFGNPGGCFRSVCRRTPGFSL